MVSHEAFTPEESSENGEVPGGEPTDVIPWIIVRLSYIHENSPPKFALNIPVSAPPEQKKAALLARLNELVGTKATSLAELRDRLEYRYPTGGALMPNMAFTKKAVSAPHVRLRVQVRPDHPQAV